MRRAALAVLLAVAVVFSSEEPLYAQAAQDKAAAEVLFEEGKTLMREKKYGAACPKFVESNRLDAGLGTSLWLADCYEKNGQTASAWGQFREAAEIATKQHDSREKVARDRANRLEPTLAKMTILVGPSAAVAGMVVQRDGVNVGQALWGEEVPVDPGPHKVSATAPHKRPWETTITVRAGAHNTEVPVPSLEDTPEPPPPPAPVPPAPDLEASAPTPPLAPERSGTVQKAIGGAILGLGVVGLGFGTYFGISALVDNNNSKTNGCMPDNMCTAQGTQDRNSALSAAKGSTIAFIAGGVLSTAALVVVLTAPSGRASRKDTIGISPRIERNGIVVDLSGRW
jgi:hypothetical protein